MKKPGLSAITLRNILVTVIVLLIGLSGVGFYFAQDWLHNLAISVSHTVADSTASGNDTQALSKLQTELSTRQDIVSKTNSIFTSSSTYQTQAVKDLTTYANATGITITNWSFTTPAVAPAAAAAAAASTLPTTSVTITLGSPVLYTSLLKFMGEIEGNLPKMQISSINLSRIAGDNTSVKIQQLVIAVYTR